MLHEYGIYGKRKKIFLTVFSLGLSGEEILKGSILKRIASPSETLELARMQWEGGGCTQRWLILKSRV